MRIYRVMVIVMVLAVMLFISGCSSNSTSPNQDPGTTASPSAKVEKIEIYHFHGDMQCYSCKTVGAYAEETVNTYFADELVSGNIVFGHINKDNAENMALVSKYGVNGASLWIGVYTDDGKFFPEENVNVWYKIKDKQEYMDYLKGVIEEKLAGD